MTMTYQYNSNVNIEFQMFPLNLIKLVCCVKMSLKKL